MSNISICDFVFVFFVQVLAIVFIVQCLCPSIVLGRPRIKEKMSAKDGVNGRLRDNILQGNARRFKRFLQMSLRGGLPETFDKETYGRHLERIKRDINQNPCYKYNSLHAVALSNKKMTFAVECKSSTNLGCFDGIMKYTTTKCTEIRVFFPSAGRTLVQNCSCA